MSPIELNETTSQTCSDTKYRTSHSCHQCLNQRNFAEMIPCGHYLNHKISFVKSLTKNQVINYPSVNPFPEFNLLRKRQCCFPVCTSVSQLFTYRFQSPVENWTCARSVTVICTKLEYFTGTYGTCLKTTTKRKLCPWRPKDSPHWHLNNFPRTQMCVLVFFLKSYI